MAPEIECAIKELCEQIADETDSRKFLELVTKLNDLLEEKNANSRTHLLQTRYSRERSRGL
jgi:hypothetical protein